MSRILRIFGTRIPRIPEGRTDFVTYNDRCLYRLTGYLPMKSATILSVTTLLLLLAPPPPAHGQDINYIVSGSQTIGEVTFNRGTLRWRVPTNFTGDNGAWIAFTLSGSAVRAVTDVPKTTYANGTSLRRSNTYHYFIPSRYMQGNIARCYFESDWCRIEIYPIFNLNDRANRSVTFTATDARNQYNQDIPASGSWTVTIRDATTNQ